ncbi:putative GMC-type oxidoreductase [Colletotrichum spaethianum]|uniref:GMC-type oxidoreductase n=1 Tax=Colletotrichum spaethianum TaxID=700344 RepID=A0AA37UIB3_9PEZI|nr:putative GMC-type oxidoreductase [Colletotrichum spaethianum]GKT47669.1 putative GMC-type oxidoreductase [Colletotrichum spaethianum]
MATPRFQIPPEFQSKIQYVDSLDQRSDKHILDSIANPPPVTSEKNIWAFWDSGIHNMPSWCQRNVADWSRICGPSWTIRVLDDVADSPSNALNWVKEDELPKAFVAKRMGGPWTGPHSADFLRGICLYRYGGVWMDVGSFLFRKIDDLCWNKLEDPKLPYQIAGPWMYGNVVANHFIASRKGDPFIKNWHDLLMHLWKDRTSPDGLLEDPLIAFANSISLDQAEARNYRWNWEVSTTKLFEYLTQIICWIRVSMIEEPNEGFSGVEYFEKKVLLFDALIEDWPAEALIGWNGEHLFDLLSVRLDAPPESEEYKKAYNLVWTLLTTSTMEKITHAANMTSTKALGTLWDMSENEGKDHAPGTFAELLRYGSVHFEQNRETECITAPKADIILRKGLLEP